jgi:serine/threonine-protein kinase
MLEIGSLLDGKYKILNEIGHGGMSVVYLALNERANKTWAVKEVRKDGGNDTTVVSQNLVAETEMLKKLDHPNLPSIIDVIDKDDSFIIVMDYIEGNSLQDLIDTDGPQHPEKVIEWAKQLCDVLGYLHSRRPPIIYRDMKPANVMLRPTGDVTLIDFGTAREYKYANQADTTYLGTRGYAAPEQFGGRGQTDARTDIYTLGATMYHLITGYSPADTNFEVLPIGKFVPQLKGSGLEKIITKCCQNDPAKRYQDCAELMAALNLVHKYDDKERLRRRMKLGVFAACVAISLISLVSGIGFRMALANTRTEQYAAYLTSARNAMDFSQKIADYKQAINLDPGDPEAYQGLIDDIDSLSDDEFVAAYNSITDCINGVDYDPANRKRNIEYLKDRDVATYSDFNFRLGTLVYLVYPSGQGASISYLNEAVESKGLAEDRQESAELILRLAELYKKTKEAGAGGNARKIEFEHEFADYWATLDDLSIRLDTLNSQTNIGYPIRICDTIATEINLHCVNYMNDNVSRDTILQTLDRANNFMNNAKSSSPDQLEVIKRVRNNVTKAYGSVDDCFSNTSNVNPDAEGSEEEGGDV